MRRTLYSVVLLSCAALFPANPGARAAALGIPLLENAEVRGDVIVLADLLPQDAPRLLRESATSISLGRAPQAGASRRILRSAILASLASLPDPTVNFFIPEVITVQRAARPLTREEVYAAIQKTLSKNALGLPPILPEDVSIGATVLVPEGPANLEVTEVTYDEFIGSARFRLWSRSAPGVHPFFATARIPKISAKDLLGSFAKPGEPHPGNLAPADHPRAPAPAVLVEPGRSALLHLYSSDANLFLVVNPQQQGHLGDIVRVQLMTTGRVFSARVVGSGALEAAY